MPQPPPSKYFSLGEAGDLLSTQSWRIARLFDMGILEEPPRVGRRRLIPESMIPIIAAALRERGWLRQDPELLFTPEAEIDRR
jgi:hypothetical protein